VDHASGRRDNSLIFLLSRLATVQLRLWPS
jgi:hypothetical protein